MPIFSETLGLDFPVFRSVYPNQKSQRYSEHEKRLEQLWISAITSGLVSLWKQRNLVLFEDKNPNLSGCKYYVRLQLKITARLSNDHSFSSIEESTILSFWNVNPRPKKAPQLKQCTWIPPDPDILNLNTDGAAIGNPGTSGIGVVGRDRLGEFIFSMWKNIGSGSSYRAECVAVIEGVECAITKGWLKIWVETDSEAAKVAFETGEIPLAMQARWKNCQRNLHTFNITSIWREANFSADALSKAGTALNKQEVFVLDGKPPWLQKWELPYECFMRAV